MPELPEPKLYRPALATLPRRRVGFDAYAELAVTTNHSFLRGASHPDELVMRAGELGYHSIAVTDLNSLAGAVRMHNAAKETGIKLIVGSRLSFVDHPELLVWPTNRTAYGRLCRLLTIGKRRATKGQCDLSIADFLEHSGGIIAAVVPPDSIPPGFTSQLHDLKNALGRQLSLAATCLYESDNHTRLQGLVGLGRACGVPLLACNDVHYHQPERRGLQDVLTCIRHGCTIHDAGFKLFQNGERYLKSPEQMHALFADHRQAIGRGIDIANECSFSLDELRYEYPSELAPVGSTPLEYLKELAYEGALARYPHGIPSKVQSLLERELNLIGELKIEAYFLTVHDLVRFARSRGILCQGRGSAANSAVCYCIGVTSVDPTRIDVLFERFVSAARNEPPDIDIDFEHERREEVIQYIYEKYGRDRAGMTAETITYRGRSAVRDVGKALGLGLDTVDQMATRLDWWDRGTLTREKIREVGLDPDDRTVQMVVSLTGELLGFPRHLSQHVGGMVITRGLLCEMAPIENASMANRTVIEWDKDDIDALNILKVDVLALGMLTCIAKCLKLINDDTPVGEMPLLMHTLPPEDPAVYDMISDADTIGVFQIESRAQMTMLPRLRPNKFYDLVIEVAIVRPGPIQGDMVHPYLRRRNGLEAVTYPSEAMQSVLEKTLGVPLFQEQAMRIAMVGAGFSAEEADKLRRGMAAWKRGGAIDVFHKKIVDGMLGNGYSLAYAEQCFNMLKGFGEYGFPESHSASFALLVYVSAWIKRHHPAIFCCGLLNSQPMGFYAPAQIVRDALEHGVTVRPVDVNASQWDCVLEPPADALEFRNADKNTWGRGGPAVRLGFRMLKGFHRATAERIVIDRESNGIFTGIAHFSRMTGLKSSALRRLAEGDAFGSFGLSRRQALWQVIECHNEPPSLFDTIYAIEEPQVELPVMPIMQEVIADYQTSGLSLKRHPVSLIRNTLTSMKIIPAKMLSDMPNGRWVKVAGIVTIRQRPATASGIVFETLEDETGVVNLIVRPHVYDRYRHAARHAILVQADGNVERQGQVIHVMAMRLHDLSAHLQNCEAKSRDFH
jgi:error-prone DNA polymerase